MDGVVAVAATARPGVEKEVPLGRGLEDDSIAARIMAKRGQEMARRSQILDPRRRNKGTEHSVLDQQVAEKQAKKAALAAEEADHVQGQKMQAQILRAMEDHKHEAMKQRHKNAIAYSLTNLNKESRREYDLSDHKLRMQEPDPGANYENVGMVAMLNFKGDGDFRPKKKADQALMNEWLQEQIRDKEERKARERADLEEHHRDELLANTVRLACEQQEKEDARQEKCEEAEENRQLAAAMKAKRHSQRMREADERQKHADKVLADPRLNELHDYHINAAGGLIEYRRMTFEEEQDIYDVRARQVLEKQMQKQAEAEEEAQYAQGIATGVSILHHVEQEKQKTMKERERLRKMHNLGQAAAKRETDLQEKRTYKSYEG